MSEPSIISGPPLNASGVLVQRLLDFLFNMSQSPQERLAHKQLDEACDLTQGLISPSDMKIAEDKILQSPHQSRTPPSRRRFRLRIRRIREFDNAHLAAHRLEDISFRVTRTASSLYRCFLSCKDAFPTPDMQGEFAKGVWEEACLREGEDPTLSRRDREARPFFGYMWLKLPRKFSSYMTA